MQEVHLILREIHTSCKLMIFGCSPYRSSNSISSYGSCFDLSIICQIWNYNYYTL